MYCETPMVHHIRRFVHGSGCVQIVLKELDSPVPGYQHTILNYSWCRTCKQVFGSRQWLINCTLHFLYFSDLKMHVMIRAVNISYAHYPKHILTFGVLMVFILPWWQVTPVVPLSNDSWSMSFAKYLELRFYGHQYTRRANAEPCGHSIHKDYHQYFSYNQMVASFR